MASLNLYLQTPKEGDSERIKNTKRQQEEVDTGEERSD